MSSSENEESGSEYYSEEEFLIGKRKNWRASKVTKKDQAENNQNTNLASRPKRQQNQNSKNYKFLESSEEEVSNQKDSDYDYNEQFNKNNNNSNKIASEKNDNIIQEEFYEDESNSIFFPQIEQILWKRKESDDIEDYYLVKYKGYSYLHLDWLKEEDICTNKHGKNRLVRFNKNFNQKLEEMDQDELNDDENFFDQSYLEVDRIVYCTDMFAILHPKKALEVKNKWTELILKVVQYLLNYTKNDVRYGVFFMEPVNPQRDGCQNYKKVITNPMDLGTIINRIYLDCYKDPATIWRDIGLVFRNCRRFNTNSQEEIRIICDTLREVALLLYRQWHALQLDQYHKLLFSHNNLQQLILSDFHQFLTIDSTIQHIFQEIILLFQSINNFDYQLFKPKLFSIFTKQHSHNQITISVNQDLLQDLKQEINLVIQTQQSNQQNSQQQQSQQQYDNQMSLEQIEKYNPGEFNLKWVLDNENEQENQIRENYYIDYEEKKEIDLIKDIDHLYLIKWKNLSYTQSSWEPYSILNCLEKVQQFKQQNRSLDKESRQIILNQVQRHKTLLELLSNPKKRQKMGQQFFNEIENRMYCLDISNHKQAMQYQANNQPVYKDRKLLRSYQLESLNWLIMSWYEKRNVILADEMGLGKTIQTTAFLNHLYCFEPAKGPFLVIAPLSTLEHWKRTVNEWTNLNGVLYYDINGAEGRSTCRAYEWFHTDISTKGEVIHNNQVYKFHVLITSYEVFLQDHTTVFNDIPFQYIVVDEAHRLKNQNAKILNTLKKMPCTRILLLTGTPVQNNTEELWTLLNYIEPKQFDSYQQFQSQFGELNHAEQIQNLHKVIKPYMLRRMKEDVESSIPPLQETIIDVEMTTIQKTLY